MFSSRLCRTYPDRPAIVGSGKSCTYEEMHRGIASLSKKLREMGVAKNTRVALWGYNSANWLIAFFAIVRAGGVAVLLNYSIDRGSAAELLTMTETAFIIFTSGTTSKPKAVQISQKALTFDVDAFNGNIDGYGGRAARPAEDADESQYSPDDV